MSFFNAGKAVGKGVKYLTKLGSSIGKGLKSGASGVGRGVDRVGAATRNTQAAAIKGARGVRDAAANAGAAARRAGSDARRGYNVGRQDLVNGDIMPKKSNSVRKLPSLKEFMSTKGKGYIRNPMTQPGNRMTKSRPMGDYMSKKRPAGDYMTNVRPNRMKKNPVADYVRSQMAGPSGPKNRRAGIITLGAAGAGYGLHKANDAVQNHYRQQKNAARGQ
jgi:hypothetical protein